MVPASRRGPPPPSSLRPRVATTSSGEFLESAISATILLPFGVIWSSLTNSVPASDLHQHLGNLLHTDVVFDDTGQTFTAHRCVLAARSPVFSAELFGVMTEGDTGGVVHIEDMEAPVLKALLYFIYTDLFPKVTEQDEDVLSQHLPVAADRYNLERLKLLCEYIDVGTVATIMSLAEQHRCHGLKKVCFHFLSSPANLVAVAASDGFKHLSRNCPSVMKELISMLGNLIR